MVVLISCQEEEKNITGRWVVDKQFDDGKEVPSITPAVTFNADGTFEYEFVREPNFDIPTSYYRVSSDTLYWTTKQETVDGEKRDSGRIGLEWQGEEMILKRSENSYTILKRDSK